MSLSKLLLREWVGGFGWFGGVSFFGRSASALYARLKLRSKYSNVPRIHGISVKDEMVKSICFDTPRFYGLGGASGDPAGASSMPN